MIKLEYPSWMTLWFVIQIIVTTWDATFIMLRPRTMKGGDLFAIWMPYDLYIQVDRSYGQLNNGFVIAQSVLNYVEVLFSIIGLMTRNTFGGFLFLLFGSIMSFSKTILYMLVDACAGFEFTGHNDWTTWITLYFLPSFVWIVFPGLVWIWGIGVLRKLNNEHVEKKHN